MTQVHRTGSGVTCNRVRQLYGEDGLHRVLVVYTVHMYSMVLEIPE